MIYRGQKPHFRKILTKANDSASVKGENYSIKIKRFEQSKRQFSKKSQSIRDFFV